MVTRKKAPARPEVAAGMAAARERGVRLGRPREPMPPVVMYAAALRAEGLSLAAIAERLNAEKQHQPERAASWTKGNVQTLLRRWDRHQQPD